MNTRTLLFFSQRPEIIPLYEALETAILDRCPGTEIAVAKTQIAFAAGKRFAFASIRGRRFIVTFGLPERAVHPRIWQSTEPYPKRWTHHVIVGSAEEIDETLLGWIEQAYHFALSK